MNLHHVISAAALLGTVVPASAAPPTPLEQQIFYRSISRQSTEIKIAARDGSNLSTLRKFNGSISFDVGSRDQKMIAITSDVGLQLLRYTESGGKLVAGAITTLVSGGLRAAAAVDLSPDGTRIAYRGGDGTKLMVYTIADQTNVEWASGNFVWDFVWARDGASIVYIDHPIPGELTRLYEVAGPQQRTEVFAKRYMDRVEVSRIDADLLLLSYNSDDGQQMLVGTWRLPSSTSSGAWVDPNLAARAMANRGVFSCDDSYLIYGSSTKSGAQTWHTRTLPSGADQQLTKVAANAEPQSWSGCSAKTSANDAFRFRIPPQ